MKILIPTDFSKAADKALQYALDCFNQAHTVFILYHSFMPFESGFYNYKKSAEENKVTEDELIQRLHQKAAEFQPRNKKARINVFVDRGTGARKIISYAKASKTDLIVMGTTGASGLKEKLIGSVTAQVMNKSACPVIGIPQKYKPRPVKRIAYCSHYSMEDIEAIKYLYSVIAKLDSHVTIWHFESGNLVKNKMAGSYRAAINKFFGKKKISFHFAETKNLPGAFDKLASSKNLDMVAMVTHRRKGFFRNLLNTSLTKQVAYHTKIPLLAIPSELI